MSLFSPNAEKIKNAALYVIHQSGGVLDFHKLFKILYFADQKHIKTYGRPVLGDTYIAMNFGPVPSLLYTNLKWINNSLLRNGSFLSDSIEVLNTYIAKSLKEVDVDYLSESDIEALDESIAENIKLSFTALTDKSHDLAWQASQRDGNMDFIKIAEAGGADALMINYIRQCNC